jgi:DNA modification methylase
MEVNKVYYKDCRDVLETFPEKVIDLTITSPPYDNLRKYNNSLEWNENVWKPVIEEIFRVTKPGGVVVWVVGDATVKGSETGTSFKQALWAKECGFNLHDTMIYAKTNPIPLTHNRYEQQFEYMFVFSKGKPKTFNPIKIPTKTRGLIKNHKSEKHYEDTHSMRKRDKGIEVKETKYLYNIWFMATGTGDKIKHNAPFPEQLVHDHIISWSNPGDIILDPFAGSGTVGKMAGLLGRKYILIEKEVEYCSDIEKRLY